MTAGRVPDECSISGSPQDFCRIWCKSRRAVVVRPIFLYWDVSLINVPSWRVALLVGSGCLCWSSFPLAPLKVEASDGQPHQMHPSSTTKKGHMLNFLKHKIHIIPSKQILHSHISLMHIEETPSSLNHPLLLPSPPPPVPHHPHTPKESLPAFQLHTVWHLFVMMCKTW